MNDRKRLTRVDSTLLSENKMTVVAVRYSALLNHVCADGEKMAAGRQIANHDGHQVTSFV